jgi:hypothetical protein
LPSGRPPTSRHAPRRSTRNWWITVVCERGRGEPRH